MSSFEKYTPALAMVIVQLTHATMALTAKAVFTQGMSRMAFIVYRQAIATFFLTPTTLLIKRGRIKEMGVGVKAFCWVFLASLVTVLGQFLNYQGLHLASPAVSTAMSNLVPVITFMMAAATGLEKVEFRSLRSIAKIVGTIICVGGAMSMTLFKGPKLINLQYQNAILLLHSVSVKNRWIEGGLVLIGSSCCWAFWHVVQVPLVKSYLDPLSLATWMCFLSALQSATLTFFLQPNLSAWKITSYIQLLSCLFAGIFGSCVSYYIMSWAISVTGPLFPATFTPLNTVFATGFSVLILHQELYIGSLIGAIAAIGGLYMVLWGKANYLETKSKPIPIDELPTTVIISIDAQNVNSDIGVKEPLLPQKLHIES